GCGYEVVERRLRIEVRRLVLDEGRALTPEWPEDRLAAVRHRQFVGPVHLPGDLPELIVAALVGLQLRAILIELVAEQIGELPDPHVEEEPDFVLPDRP